MKKQIIFGFLLFAGNVEAQNDSLTQVSFNKIYNDHTALVVNRTWTSDTTTQSLGWGWRRVANKFEISPEGKTTYLLARRQIKRGLGFALGGLGLVLGSVPVATSMPNNGNDFSLKAGVALGMTFGGIASFIVASRNSTRAANNFEQAVWLRNRDAIVVNLPYTVQAEFKQIYAQETIYLGHMSFGNGYIKNNRKQKFGLLGKLGQSEFENSVLGWDSYKKFQRTQRAGLAVYVVGAATMLSSVFAISRSNSNPNLVLYVGGAVLTGIGGSIMNTANIHLRQAIYLRNRDVLGRLLANQ
ncbi:MAG: hypothetical protein EAZ14_03630 [Runella slithyformis]|nr:MAG: hypothetical protein EAZ14_03630 [Runella slithyformis]